jgi:hypothetical protein
LESILLATEMRVEGVASLTRELRDLDRKAINKLKADMRMSIMPMAKEIAGTVPPQAPLSGMERSRLKYGGSPVNGVTRWTGVPRASVSFTPGRAKGGATKLLSMKFTGGTRAGGGIGFDYAELAGSSKRAGARFSRVYERNGIPGLQHRINGQGRAFNEGIARASRIKGKGGHFVYDAALKRYPRIEGMGKRAIDAFMVDATREIARLRSM